jgi:hypothetical protein
MGSAFFEVPNFNLSCGRFDEPRKALASTVASPIRSSQFNMAADSAAWRRDALGARRGVSRASREAADDVRPQRA